MDKQIYQINKIEGYTPNISHLISMMNFARKTTIDSVEGLSISDLDFLLDDKSNSIGMLLYHIASVDFIYRIITFEDRVMNKEEEDFWGPALNLGDLGREKIKGNSLSFFTDLLFQTREETLQKFRNVNDDWLFKKTPFWDNLDANNYFKWFHVFEDEINHRGQIRIIKKRIK